MHGGSQTSLGAAIALLTGLGLLAVVTYFILSYEGPLPISPQTFRNSVTLIIFLVIGAFMLFVRLFGDASALPEKHRELIESLELELVENKSVLDVFKPLILRISPEAWSVSFSRAFFQELEGYDYWICDVVLRYPPIYGRSGTTAYFTVLCIENSRDDWPSFNLRSTTFMDKIKAKAGWDDINFPENPAFSEMFHLSGPDEESIREVFTKELLDFLETQSKAQVHTSSDFAVMSLTNTLVNPEWYETHLLNARKLVRCLET